MRPATLLLAAALAAAAAAVAAATSRTAPGKNLYSGPSNRARDEDLPYIRCQVCELLAKNAWKQVGDLLRTGTPGNPVHEDRVIELVESMTTAWKPEGEWIAKIDLVEEGDRLAVKEMEQLGVCGVECKTVEKAADRVMGEHDTDVAEALFVGKRDQASFARWLCHELTAACTSPPPPLPQDRAAGPEFEVRKAGSHNIDAMMGGLEAQGLGGAQVKDELLQKLSADLPGGNLELVGEGADAAEAEAMIQAAMAKEGAAGGGAKPAPDAVEEDNDEYADEL